MSLITRFAPSPTGYLHLGHAYAALYAHRTARNAAGSFHLRIEDIDQDRCRPEYEDAIFADLEWLEIDWDGPVWRQSQRYDVYGERLEELRDRGLVYRCFRTRREIEEIASAPHGPMGMPFTGAPLAAAEEREALDKGRPFAWRLSQDAVRAELGSALDDLSWSEMTSDGPMTHAVDPESYGDVVLGRKDSGTSYHLASVTDDIAQGMTDIVRGEDLREAAGLHRLLYALFGAAAPTYTHHELVLGPDGKRLAKRDRAATLRSLREEGLSPEDVIGRLPPLPDPVVQ